MSRSRRRRKMRIRWIGKIRRSEYDSVVLMISVEVGRLKWRLRLVRSSQHDQRGFEHYRLYIFCDLWIPPSFRMSETLEIL